MFFLISHLNIAYSNDKKVFIAGEGSIAYHNMDDYAEEVGQGLANLTGNTVTGTYENATWSGRLSGGYNISNKFAIEIGYFFTGDIDLEWKGTYSGASWVATSANSAEGVDIAGRYNLDNNLYVKFGAHSSEISEVAQIKISSLTYTGKATKSGTGALFGFGKREDMNNGLFWDGSVTYYDSLGGHSGANIINFSLGIGKKF